ncbi:putative DNA-binding pseudobarrel domain superfamily [Helianthus annuus]|nr:putative DNA-binding pseudobarrel domain superfamily [Helianthus annuus]
MVYGFAARVHNKDRKSLKLPALYGDWIKTFNYPDKNAVIRTVDGLIFKVKIIKIAGDYFLYNGWLDMVTSLKLPSSAWVVFQYEEALSSFRLIYFYQDINLASSEYFYYQPGNPWDRDNCMSTDDEVPVVFRVDNHYRLKKKWAQLHGLDRKRDLIIKDSAGLTWDVSIGVEHSEGYPRYNVTGMKNFVRDKQLVKGSEFHMVYVKSKGILIYR